MERLSSLFRNELTKGVTNEQRNYRKIELC
jgi:hypothetical protein